MKKLEFTVVIAVEVSDEVAKIAESLSMEIPFDTITIKDGQQKKIAATVIGTQTDYVEDLDPNPINDFVESEPNFTLQPVTHQRQDIFEGYGEHHHNRVATA